MHVRRIHQNEKSMWDSFVVDHAQGTPYHLLQWKVIFERAYGLTAPYLGAFTDERLAAILPAVVIRFPFRHAYAVSLPFCNYAGWLFDSEADKDTLKREIFSYLYADGISVLELRQLGDPQSTQSAEVTHRLALPQSSEVLWDSLDPKVRNLVRKAEKMGLNARWGIEQLDQFYSIYSRNMADLGTPAHSKRFFREIIDGLRDYVDVLTVRNGDRAIASMFLLKFGRQLSDPWASSLREFNSLSPNMLLYWEALRYGADHGFEQFDFGRSHVESGTYRFKRQWGAKSYPLEYSIFSANGESRSSLVGMYRGSVGKAFSFLWRSLPYFSTQWLGPKLRRYIP